MRTKIILKLYNKISKISLKGIDGYNEFSDYIDECLSNSLYSVLDDVFITYYKTDIHKYNTITSMKKYAWNAVLFKSVSKFQFNLKAFYDENNVYQRGQNIYDSTTYEMLGTFIESPTLTIMNVNGITYSSMPSQIYYRNTTLFQKLDSASALELQVYGNDDNNLLAILQSATMSLFEKYEKGINLLINGNASLNEFCDNDYISEYYE